MNHAYFSLARFIRVTAIGTAMVAFLCPSAESRQQNDRAASALRVEAQRVGQIEADRRTELAGLRGQDGKTVSIQISADTGVMPGAAADPLRPVVLSAGDQVSIENASDIDLELRLVTRSTTATPAVSEINTIPAGGTLVKTFAEMIAIARGQAFVVVQPILPPTSERERVPLRAGYFVLGPEEPLSAEQAGRQRIQVAQAELTDGAAPKRVTRLALTPEGPVAALRVDSLPLRLERQAQVTFTNTTAEPIRLEFHNERGRRMRDGVDIQAGNVYSLDGAALTRLAGADRVLPFEVVSGDGESLGIGYLTVPMELVTGDITIPLDITGIANWNLMNPRTALTMGAAATLRFAPRVPGRTFTVTFPAIKRDLRGRFDAAGFEVKCERPTTCVPELQVQAVERTVGAGLLLDAYADGDGLVEFRVAFYEADLEPANAAGYLRVREDAFEPAFSTTWNASAFVGVLRDAYFEGFLQDTAKSAVIDALHPFRDQHRGHLVGNVRLIVRQQLGTRASGEVELVVKDKDFGLGEAPAVSTQKARLNVFGVNGFILSVGRFDFAAPTRSLAIAQSGEGVAGRWRWITGSYVVRPRDARDVNTAPAAAPGTPAVVAAQPAAGDRWSSLWQTQGSAGPLRLEASTLVGRRETFAGGEGFYVTYGGDLLAGGGLGMRTEPALSLSKDDQELADVLASDNKSRQSLVAWRASAGAYRSHRQARASDVVAPIGDEGWSMLADASLAPLAAGRPSVTFSATWAMASADDPSTPHDEGYVGESAAFAPDRIFLTTLAPKLAALALPTPDAGGQPRLVRSGVAGKQYFGAAVVSHRFSPLEWLLIALQVPSSDVGLKSSTFRWHRYALRNGVAPADSRQPPLALLGDELLTEFLLESPKGVRYSLSAAGFFPGALLRDQNLITRRTWLLDARVTVALR